MAASPKVIPFLKFKLTFCCLEI